jgi:hypothetical protein
MRYEANAFSVTNTQVVAVVKSLGAIVGTYVIAKGWLPVGVFNDILAALVLMVTAGWSWKENATASVISAAAATPEVERIVISTPEVPRTLAANPKVEATKFYMG